MKEAFGASTDFIVREFKIGETNAALCFFDGLTDKRLLDEDVLKPLQNFAGDYTADIAAHLLAAGEVSESSYLNEAAKGVLDGDAVLFIDKADNLFVIGAKGFDGARCRSGDQ